MKYFYRDRKRLVFMAENEPFFMLNFSRSTARVAILDTVNYLRAANTTMHGIRVELAPVLTPLVQNLAK